jgi:predicted  nucleic acid-binding Zn-ribbon protein
LHPLLERLIALQKTDASIQAETERIQSIPGAIAQVDARIRHLEAKLEGGKEGVKTAQKERRSLEGEVEAIKQKLSKYQGQLMEVKTNDQYRAMLHEIEGTKGEIAKREERILENMLLADELAAQVKGLEKVFQADHQALEREKAALAAKGAEAEARRAVLVTARGEAAQGIDRETLAAYQRVAQVRGGIAVAELRDELCRGCRVKVRPHVCQQVRLGIDLMQCDSCGRFLYDPGVPSGADAAAPPPPPGPAPELRPDDAPAGDDPTS